MSVHGVSYCFILASVPISDITIIGDFYFLRSAVRKCENIFTCYIMFLPRKSNEFLEFGMMENKALIFTVGYYVHDAKLPDGQEIYPLRSITLKGEATNAWHEAVGTHYELFILSQATQTDGLGEVAADALNKAFGDGPIDAAKCVIWFDAMLTANNYGQTSVATVDP